MEILISVVAKIAEYTIVPIGRQASYLIFYKGNFKTLKDHVEDLEAARERMIHSVKRERGNGKEIEKDVLNWLEKVNEVIEKANCLQNDPRRFNVRCSASSFPNLVLRHQLSRKATKIAKDVLQVQGRGIFYQVGYLPPLDIVASSSTIDGEMYDTRESLKEDILKALADPTSCNIGVYGLGGVGKTNLVDKVAQIAKEHKLFDKVVMTQVSKNPDIKKIQGEIADFLSLQFDEESNRGRAERLRRRIKMEKSILIILDNIWTILDLKEVGIPVGNEHNGCKLLMTSRNQEVLLQMDVPKDFTFKVELLSENESWSLFQFMAGDVVKDRTLKDVAYQVAQKCEGLPLRVVTVARAMKNKRDVHSWKYALKKLQSHDSLDALTYSALELSYDSLDSDEMRDLFLLFSLLPGNDVLYFLKIAMGLDILKHVNTVDDARNKLYTMIESLEATCLLLEVKVDGKIQMHDFVCEFAISIACRDKHVILMKQRDEEWPTNAFLQSGNRPLKIPDDYFEGMRSLRVLDLTCLNLSSLPTSFQFLTDLQTLCLNFCVLENMDAIEALQNLKILCLWNSSMIKLPRQIGQLTQLRMLDLRSSGIEVIPHNIISSLTKLEELYMGNTSINWEDVNSTVQNEHASIAELRKLPNLKALELQIRETWMLPRDLRLMFEKLERYKIAIGDVWDWSDIEDGTLKTLMLKLGTNIHLEHGIKALIKGVENLYLDDVDGIQNVLPNLNREGFTLLKHLHVQNNTNLNHIVDNKERNQIHASFPILETLVLLNLRNLEHICHGQPSVASFGSLSVIKVKNCVQLKYLFSFTMVKGLSHLCKIEVCECNSLKEIVFRENNSSANNDITDEKIEFLQLRSLTLEHLETLDNFASDYLTHHRSKEKYQGLEPCAYTTPFFNNAQVALPNLDALKLSSLHNLNQIWDDNYQSMCNLTSLIVDNCVELKYLFSSTMVESFMNLKHLEISNCPIMEEIIAKTERNNAGKKVNFLKLEKIILKDMDSLKTIWHYQFETSKMLEVNNCKKIVVVFPSSMQTTYNELEKLEVTNCDSVEEIFELTFNENNSEEVTTHLKEVTIDGLWNLKKIWSGDPEGILSFQNLINVQVVNCESLEYLLPFSVATRCSHLKELGIKWCGNMKLIVGEEKESSMNEDPIFEFNQLSTLLLFHSPKLNGFYAGNHTLECSSLRNIYVFKCTKLNLFRTLSNFHDDKHSVSTEQPLFFDEEVIPNLEELRMEQADADMILKTQNPSSLFSKMTILGLACYNTEEATFPYWFLENVHTLESLVVEWSCFKKIFQDKGEISEKTHPHIKRLTLNQLPKLQHICEEGSQIDPVLEFLECLNVSNCSSLINLMPSSVTLNHLTKLEITECNGLKYLISTLTARSLDKLTELKIKDCNSLEEVVNGVENVDIAFISLQILMLECLPSLVKFCSSKCSMKFPLLEKVIVGECPRMKIFSAGDTSTPILQKVKIAENVSEWHWKGNLNNTIYNMFEDKVGFGSFKHLKLSEYPELKELWYGRLEHKAFRSLKYLVVHKCDFLSDVLFKPNVVAVLMHLEELDVEDCDSLEAVFDSKDEFAKEIVVQNSTQLKKLKLSNLPKLKHVWKKDPHYTMKFENLSDVSVVGCNSLISLFPLSVARDMMQLQSLQVSKCGIQEIVAKEEGTYEMVKFVFPHLTSINLEYLTKLKAFFVGVHSLQCKSLKKIKLFGCPKIELFKAEPLRHQESSKNDVLNISTYQPLFVIEEVAFPDLDALKLSSLLHLNQIWDDNYQPMCNLTSLIVDNCVGLKYLFSSTLVESFMNLKHLEISNCPIMEEIIAKTERNNAGKKVNFLKLEKIILKDMDSLKTIWHYQFETSKMLEVNNCKKIVVVFPSSMQNTYYELEKLEVTNCALVEEIFELTFNQNNSEEVMTQLKEVTLGGLFKLKKIWSGDPQGILSFQNLINVQVISCASLEYLLPFSVATRCSHLKELGIKWCGNMKDIVAEEKESRVNAATIFEFNQLSILSLLGLYKLNGFYAGNHTLACPSLRKISVSRCTKLKLFRTLFTRSSNFRDGKHSVLTEQPLFIAEEVIPNLEVLKMAQADADLILQTQNSNSLFSKMTFIGLSDYDCEEARFPYWFLENVHTLESLLVEWSCFKKIFQDKGEISEKTHTQIKTLMLNELPKLQHICEEGSQIDPVLEFLEYLDVDSCSSLTNLMPSSVTLNHLTKLEIIKCNGLKYLITTPTARSLDKLTVLKIKDCNSLDEVVTGVENVDIAFMSLQILMLECLPSLIKFCSVKCFMKFPSLEKVIVGECPRMKIFSAGNTSTPILRKVKIAEIDSEWHWKGNLNDTIYNMFEDKVGFGSFKHLKLSEYPELKELWYGRLENNTFRSLKYLVVHKCDFLFDVLFQPNLLEVLMNLEELDVEDCNSLEAVFDLKDEFAKEIVVQNSSQLKKLKLSNLPKLKHVWKEDPHYTMRFQNLSDVSVVGCKNLINIFPLSVAKGMLQLQSLRVSKSGIQEIVAKEDGTEEIVKFVFPQLTSIILKHLPKLKAFFVGVHSLQCKSLKTIKLFRCPKIELFKEEPLRHQESSKNDELNISKYQPLFVIEEVLANVENLNLNNKDFDKILQTQYAGVQFNNLKHIAVCEFYNEEANFPYWFLKNVPNCESLLVQWSLFTEIFQGEQTIRMEKETQISPQLKQLKLLHLSKLQCICKEGFQMDPVLQFLESIYVYQCSSLTMLVPSSVSFSYMTFLEVTNCNGLKNLITHSTAKSLVKLATMKIKMCNWLEDIVNGKEDETNEIEFCSLQTLELTSLERLSRFCSCSCTIMFPLLEVVVVKECPRMELFSFGVTKTTNLQHVQTEEEKHWVGDLNGTIKKMFVDKVAFGSFKHLKLSEYPELKELWYGNLEHTAFRSLKYLVVHKCDFLSDVLFQPNLLEVLMNLEELDVENCNSLEAVFDLKDEFAKEIVVQNSTQLKKLKLSNLPKLKHVWKVDPHYTMRFQNLSDVSVGDCESLISLFPLSVARDMKQLQSLRVSKCGIQEIVGKEEGTNEIVKFVFPQLTSITLHCLTKLKAFFDGGHSLQCKSLKTIKLFRCPKIELFKAEPLRHQKSSRIDELNISQYQPLFVIEEFFQQVLANVENLNLNNTDFGKILQSQYSGVQFNNIKHITVCEFYTEEATFPYWFLKDVPNLETLLVKWSSFTEIFQGEQIIGTEKEPEIIPQLRKLTLWNLSKLQCICKEGFQMDPVLQFLESIYVYQCSSLTMLVPSSVSFSYMTFLEVTNCNGLKKLITHSTAKSLVKLTTMKIKMCNWLEDIVNGKEDETNEIVFCSLQTLELISLQRLCRFSSCPCPIKFPLLKVVVVKECPRMELFSLGVTNTTNLQNVQTDEGNHWEGDLNRTIKKMFCDKVAFGKFKYLALSDYPELKDVWYGQLHCNVFCNLKHLVVERCDFLSHVLFPSNVMQVLQTLEELEVKDCDSLEAVFDVKGMKSQEILIKENTQLKRLTLSTLPKLKHIWNEDPHEIISFGNLHKVDVSMCQSLLYVFPYSLSPDLGHLEMLEISSCRVKEIVAMEETVSMEIQFNFPQLKIMALRLLSNLKSFYQGKHTLDCPSLKTLNVYRCEALRMFSFNNSDLQQPYSVDQQPLFCIEKLSPNLEELAVNGKDMLGILNGYCQENIFHKVKFLHLQCFDETPTILLNDFHTIFPTVETFQVRNSSFETLFPAKGATSYLSMQMSNQIRNLWLFELDKLNHVWQEDFPLDYPLLQYLEELCVVNCPSLISLVSSSTSFTNLTHLKVDNCKELIYLIKISTAKSLVQLKALNITNCEKMLDVVKIDDDKAEENIVFENLEYLEFTSLSNLRSFCYGKQTFIFPSLLSFIVKGCPQMKIFSSALTVAPCLTSIEVEEENMRWEGDLNTTIEQMFIEKEVPLSN
ncbi:uncharacterized protein [Medicago truncatula]|uniref:uncharacterized protein isoform X3 n=1 Tax=Medicago truncatula TaxID=3880 RepID=UPI0019676196|nr:uncharacterized protein LOC25501253 isoform X3 [Medicago truncatula]